jgi:hypothetical protein
VKSRDVLAKSAVLTGGDGRSYIYSDIAVDSPSPENGPQFLAGSNG